MFFRCLHTVFVQDSIGILQCCWCLYLPEPYYGRQQLVRSISSSDLLAPNFDTDFLISGTPGNICSFSNGLGSCAAGLCAYSSCNSGWSLGSNTCTAINLATDVHFRILTLGWSMLTHSFSRRKIAAHSATSVQRRIPLEVPDTAAWASARQPVSLDM